MMDVCLYNVPVHNVKRTSQVATRVWGFQPMLWENVRATQIDVEWGYFVRGRAAPGHVQDQKRLCLQEIVCFTPTRFMRHFRFGEAVVSLPEG